MTAPGRERVASTAFGARSRSDRVARWRRVESRSTTVWGAYRAIVRSPPSAVSLQGNAECDQGFQVASGGRYMVSSAADARTLASRLVARFNPGPGPVVIRVDRQNDQPVG